MKSALAFLCALFFTLTASAQLGSAGDLLIQMRTSDGYALHPLTPGAGKTIGFDGSGNLTLLTPFSGAFSALSGKPTTLAGYGITDPVVLTSGSYVNPGFINSLAWGKITSTPSTLAGYGITDAVPAARTVNGKALSADISLAFADLASHPTTLSGYGITDAVPSSRTINGYALSANLTLAFSDLVNLPTTLAGYGIGDAVPSSRTVAGHALSGNVTIAFADLASQPTTLSGYGITDAVPTSRTINGYALSGNLTLAFSDLVNLPTTLAGYGIGDAVPSSRTVAGHALSGNVTIAFADLASQPTTLSGYGITDAQPVISGLTFADTGSKVTIANTHNATRFNSSNGAFEINDYGQVSGYGTYGGFFFKDASAGYTYAALQRNGDGSVSLSNSYGVLNLQGNTITSGGGTLTLANNSTLTINNNVTLATDGTGTRTLNIGAGGTLGDAAFKSTGTSANNIVKLDGSAKLPAVDGSQLTNLPSGGASLSRVSNGVSGWTTPGAAATRAEITPDFSTFTGFSDPQEFSFSGPSGPITFSFGSADPSDGSTYVAPDFNVAETNATNLVNAINSTSGFTGLGATKNLDPDDGVTWLGTVTIYDASGTTGASSIISTPWGNAGGADATPPTGYTQSSTLVAATSGKKNKIISLVAKASGCSSWQGTLVIAYATTGTVFSVPVSSIQDGVLLLPRDGSTFADDRWHAPPTNEAITISFTPTDGDFQNNFGGGTLTVHAIIDVSP